MPELDPMGAKPWGPSTRGLDPRVHPLRKNLLAKRMDCRVKPGNDREDAMNILLTPARIGPVEIPNRIVMPPMTTRTADAEGYVTEDTLAYYLARARGGVGLITVEMASPEKAGRHRRHEVGIYDDRFLPGLTRLVDLIHRAGSKASIQLGHGGGHTRIDHLRRDRRSRLRRFSASGLRDHVRDHRA